MSIVRRLLKEYKKGFSPEFRRWFGNSKVVDRNGQPLVMYHGTHYDFDAFYAFSHFGTAEAANHRVYDAFARNDNGRVLPVYLSIQNPLRIRDNGLVDDMELLSAVFEAGGITEKQFDYLNDIAADDRYEDFINEFERVLRKNGYDGMVYQNIEEDKGKDSWIALNPKQIKSVFNSGRFNSEDARMNESAVSYPQELSDIELADYVVEQTPDDIHPGQVEEFFRGARGILKKFPIDQLRTGPEDNHLEKYPAWDKFDPDTAPPLVVEDGVIVDGHHRYRSALKVGAPYVWAYDVVGDEE